MILKQLLLSLATGKLAPVYLLLGNDLPGRQQALNALRATVCPDDAQAWNLEELDGESVTGAKVLAMANTLPFLGDRRLLIVHNYSSMPLAEQEQLTPLLASLPSFCVIVLVAEKLDKRTKQTQIVLAHATVVELDGPVATNAASWLVDLARTMGLTLDAQAAEALVDKAGSDAGFLAQELEKLAVYVGNERRITKTAIEAVAAEGQPELISFAGLRLAEATAQGDVTAALGLLSDLLNAGEAPLRIMGALAYQYRLLLAAKAWEREGPAQAASALGVSNYPMQKAFKQARRLSSSRLLQGLLLMIEADQALKRSGDPAVVMPSLVVRLAQIKTPD